MKRLIICGILLAAACGQGPELATVSRINRLLKSPDPLAALPVAEGYLKQHPGALPVLRLRVIILLKTNQPEQALSALRAFPVSDPVWEQILRHDDSEVRIAAAKLIASYDKPLVDERLLIRVLDDREPEVRRNCARTLGRLRVQAAMKPIFRLLGDDDGLTRAEAATALGRLGDTRAIGWLARLIGVDGDKYVRLRATCALRELASESTRARLLAALDRGNADQKFSLAVALAKLGEGIALGSLTNAFAQTNREVRLLGVIAVGDLPPNLATNALQPLVNDPDPMVKKVVNQVIHKSPNDGAKPEDALLENLFK